MTGDESAGLYRAYGSYAEFPLGSGANFRRAVNESVAEFGNNTACRRIDGKTYTMGNHTALLRMIFHQTFEGPSTFAMAAANCDPIYFQIRDYMIRHADEEKSHWMWILDDLHGLGDVGPDPRASFAPPACQAYVAFNVYIAQRAPVARLGIAAVLESIGGQFGKEYALKTKRLLGLTSAQLSFFFGHGDTDVGHSAEILSLLESAKLSAREWAWLEHAARTAGYLYRQMYEEAVR